MDYNTTLPCQTNNFKEVFDDVTTNSLNQNFLTSNQIDDEILSITPSQDYKPLGLFHDQHGEEFNYPTLFFGNHHVQCIPSHYTYQEITKWELMHKDHKFARHIPNLFFKVVKILYKQYVQTSCWIWIHKGKLHGHDFTAEQVTKKPILNKFL